MIPRLRRAWRPLPTASRTAPTRRLFSSTRPDRATTTTTTTGSTHYDTLGVSPSATAKEIKRQFYALSKTYHPDLHPDDPTASSRFVEISEAYTVLGSPEKRAVYDRDVIVVAAAAAAPSSAPTGSHSSHTAAAAAANAGSGPAGGRAPSGLSRRRTQFRGPPPSFYRSGGWGAQGAKRAEHAARGREEPATGQKSSEGAAGREGTGGGGSWAYNEPGTGPGGYGAGWDNDVPHWDREGHYRTQEGMERMRSSRMRKREPGAGGVEPEGSVAGGFFAVTAVIGAVFGISVLVAPSLDTTEARRREVYGRKVPS